MKKYDTIEQQLTEGFWDALVNKAKGAKHTLGAMAGNQESKGKLDTHMLATELYNQFKRWAGNVGAEGTRQDVADFLIHQVNLGMEFVNSELKIKYDGQGPSTQVANAAPAAQSQGGNDYDSMVGTSSTGGATDDVGDGEKYEPAPDEFQPQLANIGRFMKSASWRQFKEQRDATGYNESTAAPFTKTADGTFIFADKDDEDALRKLIQVVNAKPVETAEEMKREAFFVTWEDFKSKVPGASRINKDSPEEADLFRQACFQALAVYGKNFPKGLHRFILSIPPEPANKQSSKDSLTIVESKLKEDAEDAQLRKMFLKIAQDAIRSGAFRDAAQNYSQNLRQGGKFVGNYQVAPGQNAEQAPQEDDLLAKAKELGSYLGVSLSKWDLRAFRNKNKQMFYDFMTDLKSEDPSNWDTDFINHCKQIFNIKGDVPGAEGQQQAQKTQATTQSGPVGKGEAANDSTTEGDFVDIRGEHVKWDEKQGTLTVGTKDERHGNKVVTRVYEPLAGGGWVERGSGRQFAPTNGFSEKLTDLQDSYMKETGMSKPQVEPVKTDDQGPTVPVGAVVKANNGEYKFNGSQWKTAEDAPVTSEKAIAWLNDQYEKQKNGAKPAMQPAKGEQNAPEPAQQVDAEDAEDDAEETEDSLDSEPSANSDTQKAAPATPKAPSTPAQPEAKVQTPQQPEQPVKPQQPANTDKPAANEPEAKDKSGVPNNATFKIPKTDRVIQRKQDGWYDSKGGKITDQSKVDLFDRGWKKANGRDDE